MYFLLSVGFLFALGAAGVDLSRVTLLAGALGVGVGFGLQSVVNNFVSGLILLFERPVKIGHTIEVGTLLGEVTRIRLRSSTVRTFDGAEVIVPNANLVSDQVINWTLSDRQRRLDVAVGVRYGTDPERVLAILQQVAESHPQVLKAPVPVALFRGFGDSSLDFLLRVWVARFDEWFVVQSDLHVAVNRKRRRSRFPTRNATCTCARASRGEYERHDHDPTSEAGRRRRVDGVRSWRPGTPSTLRLPRRRRGRR